MITKRFQLIFLLFIYTNITLLAQKDYFCTDSLSTYGVTLIDNGSYLNSKQCELKRGEGSIIYGPDKVAEYGFSDGRVYLRKTIKIDTIVKKVFLERLIKGKITLFFYKGDEGSKFFLKKDSGQLIEIVKKGLPMNKNSTFKDILKIYTNDCINSNEPLKLVSYNKPSLKTFIKLYNNCKLRPFPFIKYGIILGFNRTTLTLGSGISDEILKKASFNIDNALSYGIFLDIPLLQSEVSVHPEIYYQKSGFTSQVKDINSITDFVINTSSVNVPLIVRYIYPSIKIRPFVNLGFLYSNNFRNIVKNYAYALYGNVVEISQNQNVSLISTQQYGYILGGGIQFKINYREYTTLELRYNNMNGFQNMTLGNIKLQLVISLNM